MTNEMQRAVDAEVARLRADLAADARDGLAKARRGGAPGHLEGEPPAAVVIEPDEPRELDADGAPGELES